MRAGSCGRLAKRASLGFGDFGSQVSGLQLGGFEVKEILCSLASAPFAACFFLRGHKVQCGRYSCRDSAQFCGYYGCDGAKILRQLPTPSTSFERTIRSLSHACRRSPRMDPCTGTPDAAQSFRKSSTTSASKSCALPQLVRSFWMQA